MVFVLFISRNFCIPFTLLSKIDVLSYSPVLSARTLLPCIVLLCFILLCLVSPASAIFMFGIPCFMPSSMLFPPLPFPPSPPPAALSPAGSSRRLAAAIHRSRSRVYKRSRPAIGVIARRPSRFQQKATGDPAHNPPERGPDSVRPRAFTLVRSFRRFAAGRRDRLFISAELSTASAVNVDTGSLCNSWIRWCECHIGLYFEGGYVRCV